MIDLRVAYRRVFETVRLDDGNKRSGATFVNILFGLVVTQAAVSIAEQIVVWYADGWEAVETTRCSHLLLALTLTVLSWIGYHQSQQYPPFLMFMNLPMVLFVLDVLMVVALRSCVARREWRRAGPRDRAQRPA